MINITSSFGKNEYDIHSLTKAFYPAQDIKFEEVRGPENGPYLLKFDIDGDIVRCVLDNKDRDELKRRIYDVLSEKTGKKLPWGILTGIRPTKMAMQHMNSGMSEAETLELMKRSYYISDEKGRLSIDIADREKEILSHISYTDGYSMYIDIPFCPTTCLYCSFTSNPIGRYASAVPDYLDALEKEIRFTADLMRSKTLDTVYIGGGTPTTLEAYQLERLLGVISDITDTDSLKEFTVEAGRADSISADKLDVMKKHGVSRISVNPQTMKEETLRLIGRRHTVQQVKDAFMLARDHGFDNINMDIILGLPEETDSDVRNTIEEISRLSPDSLTVHSLAVKRASKLSEWIFENGISALNNTEETMRIAADGAAAMGMLPYYLYRQKNMSGNFENTGYAKPGKYGIYNILIMEEVQSVTALGAGGISKAVDRDGNTSRDDNPKDLKLYMKNIDEMLERKRRLFSSI